MSLLLKTMKIHYMYVLFVQGKNYNMGKQVGFCKETLERYREIELFTRVPKFASQEHVSKSLSNSIFMINIGSSDYIYNYLQPSDYNSNPE